MNPPDVERKGAAEIGKLFVAFGSLEIITYKCLTAFSVAPSSKQFSTMQLASRIEVLVDLVSDKDLVEPNKQEFIHNLQQVKGLLARPAMVVAEAAIKPVDECTHVNFYELLHASRDVEMLVSGLYANMAMFRNEGINA